MVVQVYVLCVYVSDVAFEQSHLYLVMALSMLCLLNALSFE